jgi:hypothetical protein
MSGYVFFDTKVPPFWLAVRFGGVGIAVVGTSDIMSA